MLILQNHAGEEVLHSIGSNTRSRATFIRIYYSNNKATEFFHTFTI